jgi:hypothetical protein
VVASRPFHAEKSAPTPAPEGTEWWALNRLLEGSGWTDLPPPAPVVALVPDDPSLPASVLTGRLLSE